MAEHLDTCVTAKYADYQATYRAAHREQRRLYQQQYRRARNPEGRNGRPRLPDANPLPISQPLLKVPNKTTLDAEFVDDIRRTAAALQYPDTE